MGPTASGKSALAELLAQEIGAQLISADAFQVYRGFDIGTAKPEQRSLYELLDICEPFEPFGAGDFVRRCLPILERCFAAGQPVVLVGGTGFYVRALMEEYKDMAPPPDPNLRVSLEQREEAEGLPALAAELLRLQPDTGADLNNPVRVRRALEKLLGPQEQISFQLPAFWRIKWGLDAGQEQLSIAISRRIQLMLSAGWEQEVRSILDSGLDRDAPAWRAIGYETLAGIIEGRLERAAGLELIEASTRQYAKRQRTWLRKEPGLNWVAAPLSDGERLKTVKNLVCQIKIREAGKEKNG